MISKKDATFYIPGKGVERVDDDGFSYPESESMDYCEFLNSWFNMHDGGVDDDL